MSTCLFSIYSFSVSRLNLNVRKLNAIVQDNKIPFREEGIKNRAYFEHS